MRYEALSLREFKSASHQWLEVSHVEWLKFAEQSLDYGFYSISIKVCVHACHDCVFLELINMLYSKN